MNSISLMFFLDTDLAQQKIKQIILKISSLPICTALILHQIWCVFVCVWVGGGRQYSMGVINVNILKHEVYHINKYFVLLTVLCTYIQ